VAKVVLHTLAGSKKALDAARLVESLYLAGHRVVVFLADAGRAGAFDQFLWTFSQSSFVPHGVWDGAGESDDPVVLLSGSLANVNGATRLVTVDRLARAEEAAGFAEVHDLVTAAAEEQGASEMWRAAGFEVTEVRGVPVREG
jgi:DNA polymerase IIIc chi subunit